MGCSEPEFWDNGGLYQAVSVPIGDIANTARYALGLGAVAGTALGVVNNIVKNKAIQELETISVQELRKRI
ncbi:hypothetical protein TI04_10055 [Achromatium sp. WMS2]|nr:hypothetical protein TI04_10055 [Achromatium sp. WMS2]